jgi:threonine/homoserine/homoserine lactone efflux protein
MRHGEPMRFLFLSASAFLCGFVGSVPLAGPIAVMVVSRAAQGRFRDALRISLGASVAEGIYAGGAFWAFTRLLAPNPLVVPISRGAAALVLIALGVRFMFWRPKYEDGASESKAGTALLGFTISAVNPTLFVTWSAIAAFVHSAHEEGSAPTELDSIPFGVAAAAGIACWFAVLIHLLRRLEGKLPRQALTLTVRGLGLCLMGLGVWSAIRLGIWWTNAHDPHSRKASQNVSWYHVHEERISLRRRERGLESRVVYGRGAGHRSWGPIVEAIRPRIDWLLDGDPMFGSR